MWVESGFVESVVAFPTRVVPRTLPAPSVAAGPPTGPTALHVLFVPSCRSVDAFWISASVSGGVSSCAIRLRTAGVYGAAAETDGEVVLAGSVTGTEYGTTFAPAALSAPASVEPATATSVANRRVKRLMRRRAGDLLTSVSS